MNRNKILIKIALWILSKVDESKIEYKNSWSYYKNSIKEFS